MQSKTIVQIKAARPWIRHIDDERSLGNSIIVTLTDAFCFADDPGCGVKGFDTVSELRAGTRKSDVVEKLSSSTGQSATSEPKVHLTIPAMYWDDFSDRCPVDEPSQMPNEVRRSGSRVTVEVNPVQMEYLGGDADFYAGGNTDGTPPGVLRGAKRVAELCASFHQQPKG
ncbi:hypothetical protein [Acidovorax sp.]|uniref:hypothetical protein n=1 Tax=Acidovorax sp. TaxID=1872122 RepID=UPI0025BAF537|nr:hypothetical protein [Acidovorax sp.]